MNVEEDLRIKVLEYFGLFTFVPIDDDYTGEVYEYNDEGVYGPWGKTYNLVSEEEFQRLLNVYYIQVNDYTKLQIEEQRKEANKKKKAQVLMHIDSYNHDTERKLNSMALWFVVIVVLCSIGLVVACASFADSFGDSKMTAIVIFFAIVVALILIAMVYMCYLAIKVFTNISNRTTDIHKILEEKR